jgi:hypothetical protein
MVTANQLHVLASNRPSSGCTSNEKALGLYNIQCDFCLMTRSCSSYHIHYSQFKLGSSKQVGKVTKKLSNNVLGCSQQWVADCELLGL